jgi:hypothetical protein
LTGDGLVSASSEMKTTRLGLCQPLRLLSFSETTKLVLAADSPLVVPADGCLPCADSLKSMTNDLRLKKRRARLSGYFC